MTGTSVNPARSTGPALFVGGWAIRQLWLFWVAPIVGGARPIKRSPHEEGVTPRLKARISPSIFAGHDPPRRMPLRQRVQKRRLGSARGPLGKETNLARRVG